MILSCSVTQRLPQLVVQMLGHRCRISCATTYTRNPHAKHPLYTQEAGWIRLPGKAYHNQSPLD